MTDESEIERQYELWDEFRTVWPIDRLEKMTLDECTSVGSNDTFTRWIEARLDGLGSIWGGSSFKFGVFSRKDTEAKPSGAKLSYSDSHGWYTRYGATAEEAFQKVRGFVVAVARMAQQGDATRIEDFVHLGEAVKWKIAFHYQDRSSPFIVNVFTRAPLAAYIGASSDRTMADLQAAALAQKPGDVGLLEFGRQIWDNWGRKNLAIWKLSHGAAEFSEAEFQHYLDAGLAVMHQGTKRGQGPAFLKAPVGTLFFLTRGNSVRLLAQFISAASPSDRGEGWMQRKYRFMTAALKHDRYTANRLGWSPQANTTFMKVKPEHISIFEGTLLRPYFDLDLAAVAAWAGGEFEVENPGVSSSKASIDAARTTPVAVLPATNRIYYGPPGTGKTYKLARLIEQQYEDPENASNGESEDSSACIDSSDEDGGTDWRFRFVTFHQTYGYEEFVEGLRPVLRGHQNVASERSRRPPRLRTRSGVVCSGNSAIKPERHRISASRW